MSLLEKILRHLIPFGTEESGNWKLDADLARHEQDPLRARALLYWSLIIIIILCVWSAFASLEEVTRGQGRVITSRQVQI